MIITNRINIKKAKKICDRCNLLPKKCVLIMVQEERKKKKKAQHKMSANSGAESVPYERERDTAFLTTPHSGRARSDLLIS